MAEPPGNIDSQPTKADSADEAVGAPSNCHELRMKFAALERKEKYEALLTLLEETDLQDDFQIKLADDEDSALKTEKGLDQFVALLVSSPKDLCLKFVKSMRTKGHLIESGAQKIEPETDADADADLEPADDSVGSEGEIDPDLIIREELNQAVRFRLAALVYEQENEDVSYTSALIVNRVEQQWALIHDIPDDEPIELPDGMKFSNHSKTASDLAKSNELRYVDKVSRDKTYRLTPYGVERAKQFAADQQQP